MDEISSILYLLDFGCTDFFCVCKDLFDLLKAQILTPGYPIFRPKWHKLSYWSAC